MFGHVNGRWILLGIYTGAIVANGIPFPQVSIAVPVQEIAEVIGQ